MAKLKSRRGDSGPEAWRFFALNSFVDVQMRNLPRVPALVFIALWRDSKPSVEGKGMTRGFVATTSRTTLANRVGCSESAVTKALKRLKAMGLVKLILAGRPGQIARYQVRHVQTVGG